MMEQIYETVLLDDISASSCLMVGGGGGVWQQIPTEYYLDFMYGTMPCVMLGGLALLFIFIFLFLFCIVGVNHPVLK